MSKEREINKKETQKVRAIPTAEDYLDLNIVDATETKKLKTIIHITKLINSTINIDKLLSILISSASKLINAEEGSLMLLDKSKENLLFHSVSGSTGDTLKTIRIPIGSGIAGKVAKSGTPEIVDDAQSDPNVLKTVDEQTNFTTRNIVAVPMKTVKGEIIGVLEGLNSIGRKSFSQNDLEMLQTLADQAAIAFANRSLLRKVKMRVRELSALHKFGQSIIDVKDTKKLLQRALIIIKKTIKAKYYGILINNQTSSTFNIAQQHGFTDDIIENFSISSDSQVLKLLNNKNKFLLIEQISKFPELKIILGNLEESKRKDIPVLISGLYHKKKLVGLFFLIGDGSRKYSFSPTQIRLLLTISNQVSESYENVIYKKEEEEKQRIQKELEIMRNLQQSILPKKFPTLPGISLAGMSLPALEVGGDFYDYLKVDEKRFGLTIADVAGKGMPSALFMALSRNTIRSFAFSNYSPEAILECSNKLIYKDSDAGMFVTIFFVLCDIEKKKVTYSNGGHGVQLYYRKSKGKCFRLTTKGVPLGVVDDTEYEENSIKYEQGDFLFLYTDGVIEAFNEKNEEFGEENLIRIIEKNYNKSPENLIELINFELNWHTKGCKQFDDITMMILKFEE